MNIVVIASDLYGDSFAVARHVYSAGMLVEMAYQPPVETRVTVHFQNVRDGDLDEIVVRCVLKHYQRIDGVRVAWLSFVEFVESASEVPVDRVH